MINGMSCSQAHQLSLTRLNHYKKLKEIMNINKISNHYKFDKDTIFKMNNLSRNHIRNRSFQKTQTQRQLKYQNRKLTNSLIKISTSNKKLPTKKMKKHGNWFGLEQKMKEKRQKENPQMARRILSQKGSVSFKKGEEEYQRSRERVKRLQKFARHKKLSNIITEHDKIFTQPSVYEDSFSRFQQINVDLQSDMT